MVSSVSCENRDFGLFDFLSRFSVFSGFTNTDVGFGVGY
jgi:hypothetical protein